MSRLLLAAMGAAILAWHLAVLSARGPFYLGTNNDPDYTYLLNSLNLARGLPVFHVDHPGTPVQLLGAAVLRISSPFASKSELAAAVIRNPEHYLRIMAWSFISLYAVVLTVVAFVVLRSTGSLLAALAVQATPLLSATIPLNASCVAPEVLLLSLSSLMAMVVFAALRPGSGLSSRRMGAAFGVIIGVGIATKVTFLPLALLPLFLLPDRPAWAAYAVATVGSCAVATMPAWPRLEAALGFYGRIATHTGRYGYGPAGLFDPPAYARNLGRLFASEPAMAAVLLTALAALAIDCSRIHGRHDVRKALLGCIAALVASFLLVARHPGDIAHDRYLIPALGLTGATAALAWILVAPAVLRSRTACAALALGAVVLAVFQGSELTAATRGLVSLRRDQEAVISFARTNHPGAKIAYLYRSSNPGYALYFGDETAGYRYGPLIAAAYPDVRCWNNWTQAFETGPETGPSLLFQGNPAAFARFDWNRLLGKSATKRYGNETEALFLLVSPPAASGSSR